MQLLKRKLRNSSGNIRTLKPFDHQAGHIAIETTSERTAINMLARRASAHILGLTPCLDWTLRRARLLTDRMSVLRGCHSATACRAGLRRDLWASDKRTEPPWMNREEERPRLAKPRSHTAVWSTQSRVLLAADGALGSVTSAERLDLHSQPIRFGKNQRAPRRKPLL